MILVKKQKQMKVLSYTILETNGFRSSMINMNEIRGSNRNGI